MLNTLSIDVEDYYYVWPLPTFKIGGKTVDSIKDLEEKSLYVLREAQARFKNLSALWSTGKDSTVLVALARKAFFGHVPFPLIHIDNGIDFPETYEFRGQPAKEWSHEVIVPRSEIRNNG